MTYSDYSKNDFIHTNGEEDLSTLPLLKRRNQWGWFDMTEIQKAYLIGRFGNYEIGNISNHVYMENYYSWSCPYKTGPLSYLKNT